MSVTQLTERTHPTMATDQDQWTNQDQDQLQEQQDRSSLYQSSMLTGGPTQLSQITAAYFDQVEQAVRSARRVAELAALQSIQSQITADVTAQVLSNLKRMRAPS